MSSSLAVLGSPACVSGSLSDKLDSSFRRPNLDFQSSRKSIHPSRTSRSISSVPGSRIKYCLAELFSGVLSRRNTLLAVCSYRAHAISNSVMAWLTATKSNKDLVNHMQMLGVIRSGLVVNIMRQVDRGLFVPPEQEASAYMDHPLPIGYNATISAPHMHAMCLELLQDHLRPGMAALDVGSGTGYLTACFGLMVGERGRAVGVEHIPELVRRSIDSVEKSAAAHLLESGTISLHCGDGRQGWPSRGPYNAIHVGAAADHVPQALLDQLLPGGRLVIPVGKVYQDLRVIDKREDGRLEERTETEVRYVPLTSKDSQLRGY